MDELKRTELRLRARILPLYAPLKPGGALGVRDYADDLSEEELDFLFDEYIKRGGMMSRNGYENYDRA